MDEIITSRFSEDLLKKVDQAVGRGYFRSRSQALREIVEGYLAEHPELFIGEAANELISKSPILSDDELERLGSRLFKGLSVVEIVAEGRR